RGHLQPPRPRRPQYCDVRRGVAGMEAGEGLPRGWDPAPLGDEREEGSRHRLERWDLSEILCMTRVGRRWLPEERHDGNEHGSARARHRGSRPEAGHRPVWRRWSGKANHKTSRREDAPGGNGRASRLRAKRAERGAARKPEERHDEEDRPDRGW